VRRFWRGAAAQVPDLATRLAGSSDLYRAGGRGPTASVNFVTAHDGFTLYDLVSYDHKHNEANGENNQDGHSDNISRNWGAEGDTDDPKILEMRGRAMRNFMATLAFSQGVPMISHGDEIARTQRGNNNAYAQDNELSWMHWDLDQTRQALLAFTRKVFAIRHLHPVLRRRTFFRGQVLDRSGVKDLTWLRADGSEMQQEDWNNATAHALGMLVHGTATDETDDRGHPIHGDTMLLLLNASPGDVHFAMPAVEGNDRRAGMWTMLVDTAHDEPHAVHGDAVTLAPYSLVLLRFGRERRVAVQGGSANVNMAAVAAASEHGEPVAAD
jgi:glycogen operon protein